MADLIGFLYDRLDDDERVAQAATSLTGHWSWDHGFGNMCDDPECPFGSLVDVEGNLSTVLMKVHAYDIQQPWQGAAHIARHDPARVLAEVQAKRHIIDEHSGGVDDKSCPACYDEAFPCPTLRLLALPWDTHPDYDEAWRP